MAVLAYQYRAYLSDEVAQEARNHIDLCRQLYNHALGVYQSAPDDDKPTYIDLQNRIPEWKSRWPVWQQVYSKCQQMAVKRIYTSKSALKELRRRGYEVGSLNWKAPRSYRSIVYNQSGFDVDSNTGRTDRAILELSKIGDMELKYHRKLPREARIKQVILKEEKSGRWHVTVVIETNTSYPPKPRAETVDPADTVGIDVGVQNLIQDSDGVAIAPLDEAVDRERIQRRHRELSRKVHGSSNWEQARENLAAAYERLTNRREDLIEKLAHTYTRHYDAIFLEELEIRPLLAQHSNGRNISAMSWRKLISAFKRHSEENGCHVLTVPPAGTTKRCAQCGAESGKPLWVRQHSCPSCGFETSRDLNAALEIKRLGLTALRRECEVHNSIGLGEAEVTPAETVLPADSDSVSAQDVVETGSHVPEGA